MPYLSRGLSNLSPEFKLWYVGTSTFSQYPCVVNCCVQKPCEYWPPPFLFTNANTILSVPSIPLLYAVNKHGLDTLTTSFSDCEYRCTLEAGIMPWTVEAMVTTELSTHHAMITPSSGLFANSTNPRGFFLAVTGHSSGILAVFPHCTRGSVAPFLQFLQQINAGKQVVKVKVEGELLSVQCNVINHLHQRRGTFSK